MENKDLILESIPIIKAIRENNLEESKILINNFNLQQSKENIVHYMDDYIPFTTLINSPKTLNETLLYVANNLNNIQNRETLKWRIEILLLLQSPNRNIDVANFIINFLENNSSIEKYQMPLLVQMCVTIDRYDLLEQIRIKFANS